MRAVRIHATGGREVIQIDAVPVPNPGAGEALVRMEAVGVNFIDIYHRTGQYRVDMPFTLGQEGAGVVERVGTGVAEVHPGDRVAFSNVDRSYADYVAAPAWRLVPVPADLTAEQAAAAMLQGMTAQYLASATYPIRAGETALVHAAGGGVGQLLVQMIKRRGGRVIATVSSEAKAAVARSAGADEVINYSQVDFAAEVARLTNGGGVAVVYDSVGRDTFERSLDCAALRGMVVLFGQASGRVGPFDPQVLNAKGGLFLTRPSLHLYTHTRAELLQRAADVLGGVADGSLRLRIDRTFPLDEAAEAHGYLESRHATGKLLLIP
ncbi:MAG TPA: quinone oxidoreductase [bacterium]|jgi:NADPH2:quinone reductase|nr:quinone oxidoreductase [bacterium]